MWSDSVRDTNFCNHCYPCKCRMSDPSRFTVFATGVIFLIVILIRLRTRRKALGKAVELDTDGDDRISEEEWAAAGMLNEKEEEREEENDWWGPDGQEE